MHIRLSQKRYFAVENKISLELEFDNKALKQNLFLQLKTSKSKKSEIISVGSQSNVGKYSMEVTFYDNKPGYKYITVQLIQATNNNVKMLDSRRFRIYVSGLVDRPKPFPIHLNVLNFKPEVCTEKSPLISLEFEVSAKNKKKELHQSFLSYDASLLINDTVVPLAKTNDFKLSYQISNELHEGENSIEVQITFDHSPEQLYRIKKKLIVELKPAEISIDESEIYTNNPTHTIAAKILKRGVDLDWTSLVLMSGQHNIDILPVIPEEVGDGLININIVPRTSLWSGEHDLVVFIKDVLGRHSNQAKIALTLDQSPPYIVDSSIQPGSVVGVNTSAFSFSISDIKKAPILLRNCSLISGIGEVISSSLAAQGIHTINDLACLDPNKTELPGYSKSQLIKFTAQCRTVADIRVQPDIIRAFGGITVEEFVCSSMQGALHQYNLAHIKAELQSLYLVFDVDVLRSIRLSEFVSVDGTHIKHVSLMLDKKELPVRIHGGTHISTELEGLLSHGTHEFDVSITDVCGNQGFSRIDFFADGESPQILDRSPAKGAYVKDKGISLPVDIKYYDQHMDIDLTSVKLLVNGIEKTKECTITHSGVSTLLSNLIEGVHKLTLEVADTGGNVLKEEMSFTFDSIPPVASFDPQFRKHITSSEKMPLTGSASEALSLLILQDREFPINGSSTFAGAVDLSIGENTIGGHVVDLAGNTTELAGVTLVRLDVNEIAIQGRVVSTGGIPLLGAKVFISGASLWTFTDEYGHFSTMSDKVRVGDYRLQITPSDTQYQQVSLTVSVRHGVVTDVGTIQLLTSRIVDGTYIDTDKAESTTIQAENETDGVSIEVINSHILFPENSVAKIALQVIDTTECPVPLPENVPIASVVSLEPSGLKLTDGHDIPITFSNRFKLKDNVTLPIYVFSNERGRWDIGGFARVNSRDEIVSLPGAGIRHFSLAALSLPVPKFEILQEDRHIPGADALKGGVTLGLSLPSFQMAGHLVEPILLYNSLTARPHVKITGVFKGLEKITEVEKQAPYTLEDEKIMKRVNLSSQVQVKRPWHEQLFLGDSYKTKETRSDIVFVPLDDTTLTTPRKEEFLYDGDVKLVTEVLSSQSVLTYKITREVDNEISHEFWPRQVSSKYYLHYLETGLQKILGSELQMHVAGEAVKAHRLPPNFSIVQFLNPKTGDGSFYPTGLYHFVAKYGLEYEGLTTHTSTTRTTDYYADSEFLKFLKEHGQDESISQLEKIRQQEQSGIGDIQQREQWGGALSAFNKLDAGSVIIHNETESYLGRGWRFGDMQQLHRVGASEALCISGNSRLVFTARGTKAEMLWKTKEQKNSWNAITPHPLESGVFFVSRNNTLYRLDVHDSTLSELCTLDSYSENSEIRQYKRKYNSVRVQRTRSVWKMAQLPQSKWRLIWKTKLGVRYPSHWHTEEMQWVPETYYEYVSKPTEDWDLVSNNAHAVPGVIPIIDSICLDQENTLYFSCSNTHAIYRLSEANGFEKICGREIQETTSSETPFDNDTKRITHTTKVRLETTFTPDYQDYSSASIHTPRSLTMSRDGSLVFCEKGYHRIRRLSFKTGTLETMAGNGSVKYRPNEPASLKTGFPFPYSITIDSEDNIYALLHYAGKDAHLVKVDKNGLQTFISGSENGTTSVYVQPWLHKLVHATDIAVNSHGRIFVFENNRIVVIDDDSMDVFAGGGSVGETGGLVDAKLVDMGDSGMLCCTRRNDVAVFNSNIGCLWNIATTVFSSGTVEMQGPIGYHESQLVKDPHDTWRRIYKNGLVAIFDRKGVHQRTEDRNGNTIQYIYTDSGNLAKVVYPFGQYLKLDYADNGNPISITDHVGRITQLCITDTNLLEQVILPDGRTWKMTYDDEGRLVQKTEL